MENVSQDFNALNTVAQQHAPQPHHGPKPTTIAVVGGLAWLAVREYSHRQAIANGTIPPGSKKSVWGWYVLLAALLHFVLFLAWYGHTNTADDVFWPMFLVIGMVAWGPLNLIGLMHQTSVAAHNARLLER